MLCSYNKLGGRMKRVICLLCVLSFFAIGCDNNDKKVETVPAKTDSVTVAKDTTTPVVAKIDSTKTDSTKK